MSASRYVNTILSALPAMTDAALPTLILASTSRYRAMLLARLGLAFETCDPATDETPRPGEVAAALASRLALAKARAVAKRHPGRWVLGSDQVCACEGRLLGKPGHREGAIRQLRLLSGRIAEFHTAAALLRVGDGRQLRAAQDLTRVRLRPLTDTEIDRYLTAEPAFDCAGSFKSEGLGIGLVEAIETVDPTALIGLPLIAVRRMLSAAGYRCP